LRLPPPFEAEKNYEKSKINRKWKAKAAGRMILFPSAKPSTCVWWLQFTLRWRGGGG